MAEGPNLPGLWKKVNELLRKGDVNRSLWDAADTATPIVLEGDTLVLGFSPADMRHAGYLTTPANRARIVRAIQEITGRTLNLEVIEGLTPEDWEKYKQRLAQRVDEITERGGFRDSHKSALQAWEALSLYLHQYYQENMGIRRFPDQMARALIKLLPVLADAEDLAREAEPTAEQLHSAQLNKAFDRLATYTDLPPTMVALEYMRYRNSRKRRE